MKLQRRNSNDGFTLVELLMAMFVLSLLSLFAFRALNLLSLAESATSTSLDQLTAWQKAVALFERDAYQAREIKQWDAELLNSDNAASGLIMLTQSAPISGKPLAVPFRYVFYRYQSGGLYRQMSDLPLSQQDLAKDIEADEMPIIAELASVQFDLVPGQLADEVLGVDITLVSNNTEVIKRSIFLQHQVEIDAALQGQLDRKDDGRGGSTGIVPGP